MPSRKLQFVHNYVPPEGVKFPAGEGRTKQSFKDECDINNIVEKYQRTGAVSHANNYEAQYGDVNVADFQTAMNTVAQANTMFEDLPSSLREEFGDTAGMLNFFETAGEEELAKYGLTAGPVTSEETIPAGMIVDGGETPSEEPQEAPDEECDD